MHQKKKKCCAKIKIANKPVRKDRCTLPHHNRAPWRTLHRRAQCSWQSRHQARACPTQARAMHQSCAWHPLRARRCTTGSASTQTFITCQCAMSLYSTITLTMCNVVTHWQCAISLHIVNVQYHCTLTLIMCNVANAHSWIVRSSSLHNSMMHIVLCRIQTCEFHYASV